MPIPMTKEQMQQTLTRARNIRAEFDTHLVDARERVILHLENVQRNCREEVASLRRINEIADGNIDSSVDMLNDAIQQFRNTQDTIKAQDSEIEDLVRTLADDELWK